MPLPPPRSPERVFAIAEEEEEENENEGKKVAARSACCNSSSSSSSNSYHREAAARGRRRRVAWLFLTIYRPRACALWRGVSPIQEDNVLFQRRRLFQSTAHAALTV